MNIPEKKLPRGPHKNWAIFLTDVLDELGWTREKTCDNLDVDIGWLKKAINGLELDGGMRHEFQNRLEGKWDEYRKNKPRLEALEWPPYVESAPWDKYRTRNFPEGIAQYGDAVATVKKILADFQLALDKIPSSKGQSLDEKSSLVEKRGQ